MAAAVALERDAELMLRVREGDSASFALLLDRHRVPVIHFIYRMVFNQAVAEELRVPVELVHLVMGDTALCPDDGGTYASLTTPLNVPEIRKETAAHRGGAPVTGPRAWRGRRDARACGRPARS